MEELDGWRGKDYWIEMTASGTEVVEELKKYRAYCCTVRGRRETPVSGKLVAVNVFHERRIAKSLPLDYFRIKAVKEGI